MNPAPHPDGGAKWEQKASATPFSPSSLLSPSLPIVRLIINPAPPRTASTCHHFSPPAWRVNSRLRSAPSLQTFDFQIASLPVNNLFISTQTPTLHPDLAPPRQSPLLAIMTSNLPLQTTPTPAAQNYAFPRNRLRLSQNEPSKTPLVFVACGSYSPVTHLHLRMFEMASDFVRFNTDFELLGGYFSPVSDFYKKAGLANSVDRYVVIPSVYVLELTP